MARTAQKHHRWIREVEVTGVVLSEPVLNEAEPTGFRSLEKAEVGKFRNAHDIWNLPDHMVPGDPTNDWVQFVFNELLKLDRSEDWLVGAAIPTDLTTVLRDQQETLRPARVLVDEGQPILMVLQLPRAQNLDRVWQQEQGIWKASPTTKMERLLRDTGVELGLITNGEDWRLVVATPAETASWITWTAQTWREAPITLAAFINLFERARFFAATADKQLVELIRRSRLRQFDVSKNLGDQVRDALTLFVHEIDRIDVASEGALLADYDKKDVFEAGVTFVMRLVFLLYAEENRLLPHGTVVYDESYGMLHLFTDLQHQRRLNPESVTLSYAAYAQSLATSRLVFDGSPDPDINIVAHGGRLFDPDAHPLLEGRLSDGSVNSQLTAPPEFSDAAMLDILHILKFVRTEGATQLVSYREVAVEQVGYMYQGLLDRAVKQAPRSDALFLLNGTDKVVEPYVLASELEGLPEDQVLSLVAKRTKRNKPTLKKQLERLQRDPKMRVPSAGTADPQLLRLLESIAPFIVENGAVRPNGLYVGQGSDRRSTGSHYTPPSMTAPIVERTLGHLVYRCVENRPGDIIEPHEVISAKEILDLKVCDPAMGSGAFLVQAVRYLAERLVDAWEVESAKTPDRLLTMPLGEASRGKKGEALMPASREERVREAKRHIATHCIYGVDRNPHAVEMAKLSLWLETLSAGRPFAFVAHALRYGDALVGLTNAQIRAFSWDDQPGEIGGLFAAIESEARESANRRQALDRLSELEFASKQAALAEAAALTEKSRIAGDLVICAFFREKTITRKRERLQQHTFSLTNCGGDLSNAAVQKKLALLQAGEQLIVPFHWELEFPEVFQRANPGFDAFVGNPPYAGKNNIKNGNADFYIDWLKAIHKSSHGNSDLIAHFFRRAYFLLRENGAIGFISTNSISQGDTRKSGLSWIRQNEGCIYSALKRVRWPGEAAVVVSILFISKGEYFSDCHLDDRKVSKITAFLLSNGPDTSPPKLKKNKGKSFIGSYILGMGFTFDDRTNDPNANPIALMEQLISENPENEARIFPYIGGDEVNDSPTHSPHRFVIDFDQLSHNEAKNWPDLLQIVESKVLPQRLQQGRESRQRYWWRFAEAAPSLYRGIEPLERVLVTSRVSEYRSFAFLPRDMVYAETLTVFAIDSYAGFVVLQSQIHEIWVSVFGSSLEDRPRYVPEDCFGAFPLPVNWDSQHELKIAGNRLYQYRTHLMESSEEGMTSVYNRFHSPEEDSGAIEKLRLLHREMDSAVLQSYGWGDLEPAYDFHLNYEIDPDSWGNKKKPYRYRWGNDLRDEVLMRLLVLNEDYHTAEAEVSGQRALL